jgi:magnesium chelatase family protein
MNPCPCGYFGTDDCRCKDTEIKRYLSKISGPILDRIDLQVELKPLTTKERMASAVPGQSQKLRAKVQKARDRQLERFKGTSIHCNAAISAGETFDYCQFAPDAVDHFTEVVDKNRVSTRSTNRLAKVARTVADLNGTEHVEKSHVDEAAQFVVGGLLREMF